MSKNIKVDVELSILSKHMYWKLQLAINKDLTLKKESDPLYLFGSIQFNPIDKKEEEVNIFYDNIKYFIDFGKKKQKKNNKRFKEI